MDPGLYSFGQFEKAPEEEQICSKNNLDENDQELDDIADLIGSFNWSSDTVEKAATVILNPNSGEDELVDAVFLIKQMLCTTRDEVYPLAQEVIDSGLLRAFVSYITSHHTSKYLKLQCCFCLTNIAAGTDEQTAHVVAAGAIPPLIDLIDSYDNQLRRQALFCLANIAGSTNEYRKILMSNPQYLANIASTMGAIKDEKIEELAGWNVRNILVLGGLSMKELLPAINLYVEKLKSYVPKKEIMEKLFFNPSAADTANNNTSNNMAFLNVDLFSPKYFLVGPLSGNTHILRFIAESFSVLSQNSEYCELFVSMDTVMALTYVAKFSYQHTIRNCCLSTLYNISKFGTPRALEELDKGQVLNVLIELIGNSTTYGIKQRQLAFAIVYYIISHYNEKQVNAFYFPQVYIKNSNTKSTGIEGMFDFSESQQLGAIQDLNPGCISFFELVLRIIQQTDGCDDNILIFYACCTFLTILNKSSDSILNILLLKPFIDFLMIVNDRVVECFRTFKTEADFLLDVKAAFDVGIRVFELMNKLTKFSSTVSSVGSNCLYEILHNIGGFQKLSVLAQFLPHHNNHVASFNTFAMLYN